MERDVMDFDVDYDSTLGFVLHYAGEMICLKADNFKDAFYEAQVIVDDWQEA